MKRYWILPILIALPACNGDDSNPGGPSGNDASTADVTTGDDGATPEDTGTTSDSGMTPDSTTTTGGGSDASTATDGSDAAPDSDASDAGCPPSWDIAPAVDPTIAVPDGGGVLLHAVGTGTQDYVCKATTNDAGTTYAWTLVTPDATLSDCHAAVIGHHFASEAGAGFPEWHTTDGTYVIGAKRRGFTPDGGAGSIPWLLIGAVDAGGTGSLASTQYVQRLNTDGGNAPVGTCGVDAGGATINVPYAADYYFYGQ